MERGVETEPTSKQTWSASLSRERKDFGGGWSGSGRHRTGGGGRRRKEKNLDRGRRGRLERIKSCDPKLTVSTIPPIEFPNEETDGRHKRGISFRKGDWQTRGGVI